MGFTEVELIFYICDMRYFYTLLLVLSFGFCNAQTTMPFVNTAWSDSGFGVISEQLGGLLGIDYRPVNEPVSNQNGKATIRFKGADSTQLITVELTKGAFNGSNEVVKQVQMSGPFADVYAVYQQLFNSTQPAEEVKEKGSIHTEPILVSGKKYTATLRRDGKRTSEKWVLVIKD
jgi:hypothetical protein